MVSSSSSEEHSQNSIRRSLSSSDHVSNISSTSSSSLSHHNHQPRTMEDVWKGIISLSSPLIPETPSLSLHQQQHIPRSFQDFLGRPISENVPQIPPQPRSHNNNGCSSSSTSSPTTALSLNNNSLFRPMMMPYLPLPTNPFEGLNSSFGKANAFPSSKETSSSITTLTTPTSPFDLKHKRIVKNRESAARSRARKEAYINELERSVEELREENRMLLKIVEDARLDQLPKKRSFKRSSTAPL